ncbi:MAG: hypothetical protein QW594_03015 [Candidatus Woesearchaeota archaeon]
MIYIQRLKKTQIKIFHSTLFENKDSMYGVLELLNKNEDVSENKLAKVLKCEMTAVRNNLYELNRLGVAQFKRKKDEEFGIYTYFWKINNAEVKAITKKRLQEQIEQYKFLVEKYTQKIYFTCENECMKLESEHCMEINYLCPECGKLLSQMQTDKKAIKELKEKIKQTKEKIKIISKE